MKERENFLFWKSYWDAIRLINDAEQETELLRSICLLAFDGEDVEPKGDMARLAWVSIRPIVANNRKNFVNGCKGGEFGGKGKEFGRLGGAPIGNQNARKQPPEQPPQTTPNNPPKDKGKRNNENENEISFYDFLIHDIGFLGSVTAKYPELKTDGVRAMLKAFHESSMVDKSEDNSIAKYQNHFKNWLKYQSQMTREQTQRNLNARAEGERQAAERKKQYDETAKNAMPHDAAMNDPRYKESMAKLVAESR